MNKEISLLPTNGFESGFLRAPLHSLHRQIDRMFDDIAPFARTGNGSAVMPNVDIEEKEDAFMVTAELPGVDKKDIDVRVADNVVSIKGEKRKSREEKDVDHHLVERSYGAFQRSFTLPCDVDSAKVDAQFKDGVLHLTLPKAPAARRSQKKISIR